MKKEEKIIFVISCLTSLFLVGLWLTIPGNPSMTVHGGVIALVLALVLIAGFFGWVYYELYRVLKWVRAKFFGRGFICQR